MKRVVSKRTLIGINIYMFTLVTLEVIVTVGLSVAFSAALEALHINLDLPPLVWVLIFAVAIGVTCAFFVNRRILAKIPELSKYMREIASGDFEQRIEPDTRIKELYEIHESFNTMTEALSATEILQTDFVSNVSHEFKTPINAIEGYATLLQDENISDEDRKEYVDKIMFNTKRLSGLVGNILLLSKVDNQTIPQIKTKFSLDEQIRRAILLLENKWTEKDISFDVDMSAVEYCGNEGLMLHVWTNLVDNAVKFNPVGGEVIIRLYETEKDIVFTIADTGIGIDEKSQKHIYDKFYQSETSHKIEGNGLGLSLVKRILDNANGRIQVSNREERGCIFTVTLPKTN